MGYNIINSGGHITGVDMMPRHQAHESDSDTRVADARRSGEGDMTGDITTAVV